MPPPRPGRPSRSQQKQRTRTPFFVRVAHRFHRPSASPSVSNPVFECSTLTTHCSVVRGPCASCAYRFLLSNITLSNIFKIIIIFLSPLFGAIPTADRRRVAYALAVVIDIRCCIQAPRTDNDTFAVDRTASESSSSVVTRQRVRCCSRRRSWDRFPSSGSPLLRK